MKLRYYLRGLGIGIIVTAVILSIALPKKTRPMTEEEIKEKALAMGMVESGVLGEDLAPTVSDDGVEEEIQEEILEENPEEIQEEIPEEISEDETTLPQEEVKELQTDDPEAGDEIIVVTIKSGDGSRTVANQLQSLGIIEDAASFDAFLCQKGYDKRLTVGKHDVKKSFTNDEIALALTKKGY